MMTWFMELLNYLRGVEYPGSVTYRELLLEEAVKRFKNDPSVAEALDVIQRAIELGVAWWIEHDMSLRIENFLFTLLGFYMALLGWRLGRKIGHALLGEPVSFWEFPPFSDLLYLWLLFRRTWLGRMLSGTCGILLVPFRVIKTRNRKRYRPRPVRPYY